MLIFFNTHPPTYSYSPSVQPYSGGEASQAIGRVAREPREGEIPVELSQAAIRLAYFRFYQISY